MKPEESITDPCITGHASDSVSVALGMAHARTLKNQKYHVVAVIGDGALTGGMAYEALFECRHVGRAAARRSERQQYVDREECRRPEPSSVAPARQSALSGCEGAYQGKARAHSGRTGADTVDLRAPKARIKGFLLPTSLFEQMGFTYLGPVDGHDLKSVCELLAQAKKMKKAGAAARDDAGYGYAPSENNPEKYHGVSQFDRVTGEFLAKKKEDFSARFGAELCGLADKDARICAITAAMPSGTGLTRFFHAAPRPLL